MKERIVTRDKGREMPVHQSFQEALKGLLMCNIKLRRTELVERLEKDTLVISPGPVRENPQQFKPWPVLSVFQVLDIGLLQKLPKDENLRVLQNLLNHHNARDALVALHQHEEPLESSSAGFAHLQARSIQNQHSLPLFPHSGKGYLDTR